MGLLFVCTFYSMSKLATKFHFSKQIATNDTGRRNYFIPESLPEGLVTPLPEMFAMLALYRYNISVVYQLNT